MLKKIVAIKNVGRFKSSSASGNRQLAKHTLVFGPNGYGKTTLCAILRSLQTADGTHIIGRKTLGVTDAQAVELLSSSGNVRFNGAAWTGTCQELSIFDGTFISENIHAGDVVDIEQKRNLYRVIIGKEGVKFAEEEARLAAASREKTTEVSSSTKLIQTLLPQGMSVEQFIAINVAPDIQLKIEEQEKRLEAVKLASTIKARSGFSEIILPELPENIEELFTATIDDVAKDAEEQLALHLSRLGMTKAGESWLAAGVAYVKGHDCPFCGQDITASTLVEAYQAVFSDAYMGMKSQIIGVKQQVAKLFGDLSKGHLETVNAQNLSAIEFWQRYCFIDAAGILIPEDCFSVTAKLGLTLIELLDKKFLSPFEALCLDGNFKSDLSDYNMMKQNVVKINSAIKSANETVSSKKEEIVYADVKAEESALAILRTVQRRHEEKINELCDKVALLIKEKEDIDKQKCDVRAILESYTRQVVTPYEAKINSYLDAFNAGFRIAETKHGYPGGVAASSYQLVINNTRVDIGDGRTPADKPSFKNTLSSGDRTTLALAFFLANLEFDPGRDAKIVVFDDPFNSQDAYRRRQTIHEIIKVGRCCAQIIVLSHDANFLKQLWDKVTPSDRIAMQISDARDNGAKFHEMDLENACKGRIACEVDDLQAYLASNEGKPIDQIKKMRVVLETYCRTTYPTCFDATDWLGDIIGKIRSDPNHPAYSHHEELDQINDFTKQYHHGPDAAAVPADHIDPTELTGFVRRTLRIVNAIQA